jgi:hypothetical protein
MKEFFILLSVLALIISLFMGIDFKLLDHIKDRPLTKLQEDKRRLKEVAQLKD